MNNLNNSNNSNNSNNNQNNIDGLQREKEKSFSENAIENMLSFYNENELLCQKAHLYVQDFENNLRQFVSVPEICSPEDFQSLLHPKTILIITVNPIECATFLHWLSERQHAPLACYMVNNVSYSIYQLDQCRTIIHVNPERTGENKTRIILNEVNKVFTPTYLLMLGICYGLDMKKFSIGSVCISSSITTFRLNFRDELHSDETIFEAEEESTATPNSALIKRIQQFTAFMSTRSILTPEEEPKTAKSEMGRFLSSNSLVSSRKVKKAVMVQYASRKPKPLAGEMEGAGLLNSNMVEEQGFSNWLLIKSICDWGEKKNLLDENDAQRSEEIKDSLQAFAMTNTCGAFENIERMLR